MVCHPGIYTAGKVAPGHLITLLWAPFGWLAPLQSGIWAISDMIVLSPRVLPEG